ncbi:MAG: hypothetical protein KF901_25605 [Myxococcales bacterium]|nr:hypothetical protein [Myxococcales bacterium]
MRQQLLFFSSSLLLWAACDCGASTPGRPCESAAECASGQVCIDGTCQETRTSDGGGLDGSACGPEPWQTGVEVCDGLDNDCDGVVDNGVLSPCGDCNPMCRLEGFGPGGTPFEPTPENSDGVNVDAEGALVLDSRRINTNFIWIANTTEGSVSRFSTTPPYAEVGRYLTGPAGFAGAHFAGNDPSRTSVNTMGDAYVGNRNGNRITRISVLGAACPDTNGDGVVTTSRDLNGDGVISSDPAAGEMLPFGQDDCVLWSRFLDDVLPGENLIRAVAAQDVEGPDGELVEYVWVGGWATNRVVKVDGRTGEPVFVTDSPTNPYGFALDGNGKLWISGPNGAFAGRVDTTRCLDAASCAVDVCQASGPEGAECDTAVKARIPLPGFIPYGITVDFEQRVWIGGYTTPRPDGGTYVPWHGRYVPTAPPGSRWVAVHLPSLGIDFDHPVNGIAADARGFVYGAGWTGGVVRIDANNPASALAVPGTGGLGNKGMAIDAEGKVWSVTMNNQAVVVQPGATLAENAVTTGVATSTVGSYTYSDMTGLQLRLATNPRGYYRHLLEACEAPVTPDWDELRFEVETPAGTSVSFRVKTAESREALDALEWIAVGSVPPSGSPLSISDALMRAGVTPARYLWVEVILQAERSSSTEVITPRVLGFDVSYSCPPIFE